MYTRIEQISKTRWIYPIAIILGLLQAILFDFSYDSPLLWIGYLCGAISLCGVLGITSFLTPKRAMLFGYLFGLAFFGWGLNWIYISMATFGGAPLAFAIIANGAVVAYLSLYWLLGIYAIVKLGKTPNQRLLIAPAVIALLEWVRSVFLIGFPWLSLGYGWINTPIAAVAERLGVFGVSFFVLSLVALLLLRIKWWQRVVGMIAVIAAFMPFHLPHSTLPPKSTTVGLIQGNMPVITAYNDKRMMQNLAQYHTLTEPVLLTEKPAVVIWPESAIPYFYVEARDFLNDMFALQQTHQFDLIAGVPHANWDTRDMYNSILLQQADNQQPQFYNKSHLLAFGEYLPFRSVFAFFEDYVDIPMSDFARGTVVQQPFNAGGLTFAPSICFEAVFGDEVRQNARTAEILLNISNDAWFGQSKAQIQHLNIARMRAIENQKMLVRATNDGRTVIVDKDGTVLKAIAPFTAGALTATVYANDTQTLYTTVGDTLLIILCLVAIALVTVGRYVTKKPH